MIADKYIKEQFAHEMKISGHETQHIYQRQSPLDLKQQDKAIYMNVYNTKLCQHLRTRTKGSDHPTKTNFNKIKIDKMIHHVLCYPIISSPCYQINRQHKKISKYFQNARGTGNSHIFAKTNIHILVDEHQDRLSLYSLKTSI